MKTYFLPLLVVGCCLTAQNLFAQTIPSGNAAGKTDEPKATASPKTSPSPTVSVMNFTEQADYKAYNAGIRERGTHEELLQAGGLYQNLYQAAMTD